MRSRVASPSTRSSARPQRRRSRSARRSSRRGPGARALSQAEVRHGALGPHAVLVRRHPDPGEKGRIETRLFNFQLGAGHLVRAPRCTRRRSRASRGRSTRRRSCGRSRASRPSCRTSSASARSRTSSSPAERRPRMPASSTSGSCAMGASIRASTTTTSRSPIVDAIQMATDRVAASRADDAGEWISGSSCSRSCSRRPCRTRRRRFIPLEARKDDCLDGELTVQKVLGYERRSRFSPGAARVRRPRVRAQGEPRDRARRAAPRGGPALAAPRSQPHRPGRRAAPLDRRARLSAPHARGGPHAPARKPRRRAACRSSSQVATA